MSITVEVDDGIAVVTMDDGAANALNPDRFRRLIEVLDEPDDARAFVLTGRPGMLSAGLDLKFMQAADTDDMTELLVVFGQALMAWWTQPRPTVCAANGHAVAAGTMFAMACDHAVAAAGQWAWGLTETQIDFAMPDFGQVVARNNVRADRVDDLLLPGRKVDAATAVDVGFADELADPDDVLSVAVSHARQLADLPGRAYAATKQRLRGSAAQQVLDNLEADVADLLATTG